MPSGTASGPSDVLTMFGGKTVEVLNTDAEGRLVMADGLVAAQRGDSPTSIIDVATLTGAQMMALGNRTAGVMGDDGVRRRAEGRRRPRRRAVLADAAARRSCGPAWTPQVADLANIGERHGGMMTAAVFLREFVGGETGADPVGAHGHRRPGLQRRQPLRLHPEAGHRLHACAPWWPMPRTSRGPLRPAPYAAPPVRQMNPVPYRCRVTLDTSAPQSVHEA